MNITLQQLIEADSPSALSGDVDHMCQQLLERRQVLGISYITAGDMFMDALAPVIERLSGQ
jgi:hypothetical protein